MDPDALLRLLANPVNRALLGHLAIEPLYPRRVAELVGLSEEEASRRLRAFEKAGVLRADWANVGRTVRLYRLANTTLSLNVTPRGVEIGGIAASAPHQAASSTEAPAPIPLVGRELEVEALRHLLATRRRACVHGIGGIGKTSLVARVAAGWDGPVAWRSAAPMESPALLLHRLAATLRSYAATRPPADDEAALIAWVAAAAGAARALIVLDRAEAASDEAVGALASLADRAGEAAILVVARAFPAALPRSFAAFELGGLDRDAALALLAGAGLGREEADALQRSVAGHPLSLVIAAAYAREHGAAPPRELLAASGVRAYLLDDLLAKLPGADRDALLRLCVLDVPFTDDDAAQLSAATRSHDLLLRMEARGLVVRTPEGWHVHDLVRSALQAAAPASAHKAAAALLSRTLDPAKGLLAVRHLLLAGDPRAAAGAILDEASTRARRFAEHGLAAEYGRLLDEIEPHATSPSQRAAVLLERARLVDGATAPRELVERARPLVPSRGPLRARLLLEDAESARREGDIEHAMRLAALCALVPDAAANVRVDAQLARAALAEEMGDALAAEAYADAIAAAEGSDDPRLLALAYAGAARTAMRSGRPWRALAEEALRLARLSGHLRGEAMAHMTLTEPFLDPRSTRDEAEAALRHAKETLAIARRIEDPWMRACALSDVAIFSARIGDHDEALRAGEEGMETARSVGSAYLRAGSAAAVSDALVARGEGPRARAILSDAMDAFSAQARGAPFPYALAYLALARAHDACGEPEAAAKARAEADALWPA